jgi:hypothetical protein
MDDAIQAVQGVGPAEAAAGAEHERQRPPGGKALMRLLQLLQSEGLPATSDRVVQAAVAGDQREAFRAHAARFSVASGRPGGGGAGGSRTRARSRARLDAAVEAEAGGIAELYAQAAEQLHLGPPTGVGPQWRSLGPWTIPDGQTYGASRVNVAGRVSAIAVDPSDPTHVLVGAANGGVWESRDRGASWAPRTDYAATLTVGAVAFDPSQPSTVLCGTGEGNWWSWLGVGILRSTDGGTTWSTLCTAPFVGQGFYDLVIDPADGAHVLAATDRGLYESADGGVTWTQRRNQRSWSLSIAPGGGGSAEMLAGCSDGLYRSTNGGTSWTAVGPPGAPGAFDRLAVAIAPSNPSVAYAWGASGGTAYLWRRAGGTWTVVGPPTGVSVGQAWYDWFVAAAPDRDTQVYCGAIEAHRGDLSGSTWTWLNLSAKATGDSIHPDQHAIAFEPGNPDVIYVGNDGGLYRSPDRGVAWQHLNNGLEISEFEYISQDVGSSRWILGGTQDNGTDRWTGSAVWYHSQDGDGGDNGVNRANPQTVFHTFYGMSLERSPSRGDWGTWTWIAPPVPTGEGSLFYPPFEASATNGDTIAMGGEALYVSRNNGTAWTRLAYPAAGVASAMYVPDQDHVYVGLVDGRIYSTEWNGTTWTAPLTQLGTPRQNAWVSDLYVDPGDLTRMWATHTTVGGGRVFRSDDGGSNWTDQTGNLPGLPINAIQVDPWNRARVWVAADLGVYESLDEGATWSDFSNGLPNAFVGDLIFHPHARVLRAGMRNRGVWEIPVDGWMSQPVCGVQWTGSLDGSQVGRWFTWGWPATWHVLWTIMPTSPRPGAPQVSWTVQVERASAEYATYWITVQNLTPDPVIFEGRYCVLSRY